MNDYLSTVATLSLNLCIPICTILTAVFVILYLGPWNTNEEIDPSDWKRQYILFFAWFDIACAGIVLLAILIGIPIAIWWINKHGSSLEGMDRNIKSGRHSWTMAV